jgi:GntR family transcriptional regulator/MocR family aminotransferase
MPDLHGLIDLSQPSDLPRQRLLYEQLRAAILGGRLLAGAPLPSSRALAQALGVARNTVIYAYEQLGAEGYVCSSRLGTVVAALGPVRAADQGQAPSANPGLGLSKRVAAYGRFRTPHEDALPFMPGIPALDQFPWATWRRLCEQAAREHEVLDLSYRPAAGEPELRQAIATYVRASRGVVCGADQVIVTDGTQHSLGLCAQMLADVGDLAWIEHPGYGGARVAFEQGGLNVRPVPVDAEGLSPSDEDWAQHPPRLIYTTPSHQYPLGSVLSLPRRLALIERARAAGAWIMEDDYDSEFRHEGPPLAAMQGLVEEAPVVYLGTFSKSMFPALRLGFIVLPQAVAHQGQGVVADLARRGQVAQQRALAAFIHEGHFTTHLRHMRRLYALRQQALREALAAHWPWPHHTRGGQAGMHLVLPLPEHLSDAALATAAMKVGLSPRPLSAYGTGGAAMGSGLVMGYANTPEADMDRHIQTLAQAAAAL